MNSISILLLTLLILPLAAESSECPALPSDFGSRIQRKDPEVAILFSQALHACPSTLMSATKTSSERAMLKAMLTNVMSRQEKAIIENSPYANVDQELQTYQAANQILGVHATVPAGLKEIAEKARSESAQREKLCTSIDNRTPALSKVRNQGPTGWCYAYAAADLISHKLNTTVSALDIAFRFNAKDPSKIFSRAILGYDKEKVSFDKPVFETAVDGGYMGEAIQLTNKSGACLEKNLPSDDSVVANLKNDLDEIQRLKERVKVDPHLCSYSEYKKSFGRFPTLAMSEIIQTTTESSHAEIMMNLANKSCQKRIPFWGDVQHMEFDPRKKPSHFDEMANIMDQQLNEKSIVGVSYDVAMINPGEQGGHGSTIVARRFNKDSGECEYLLRNSWGTRDDKNSHLENKDGYYWVPKTSLKNNLFGLTYLK